MKIHRILFYTCKRYFKMPAFLLLLLALPLLTLFIEQMEEKSPQAMKIGIYAEADEAFFASLFDCYTGPVSFQFYPSKEDLTTAVTLREIECGYQFPIDFFSRIQQGEKSGLISVYVSPSTTLTPVLNETVYSILFSEISKDAIEKYLFRYSSQKDALAQTFSTQEYEAIFQKYESNGSTFHIELSQTPDAYLITQPSLSLLTLRGVFSVFILLSAFVGAIDYYQNLNNSVFKRMALRFSCVAIPTLFAALVTLLCLCCSSLFTSFFYELITLFVYTIACILLAFVLTFIIKKAQYYYAFLPLFLLGNLILSPVFFDLSTFLPALAQLKYVFLPTYYLNFFS